MEEAERLIIKTISDGKGKKCGTHRINWTPALKDMRSNVIIKYMVDKGKSYTETIKYFMERWDISDTSARLYTNEALDGLCRVDEKTKERALALHKERLESLYAMAIEEKRIESALKVLEQMAKVNGYYNDTMVVAAPVFHFRFGDEDNFIYTNGENNGGVQALQLSEGGTQFTEQCEG